MENAGLVALVALVAGAEAGIVYLWFTEPALDLSFLGDLMAP